MHQVLRGTILSIDVLGVGVRPDLLKSNVAIPGDKVDDNIHVVEVRWDEIDIHPTGRPDSIGELFEESIEETSMLVEIELVQS